MANNGNRKAKGIIYDDLSDVADAWKAMDVVWARLLTWTAKPYVSQADVDSLSDELRRVEAGLRTTRKYLVERLEEEEA